MADAIEAFAEHVVVTGWDDVPDAAITAAKTFILDSFGVGMAGTGGPYVKEWIDGFAGLVPGTQARVWGYDQTLAAPAAAAVNGYFIHNSEYDCVHEKAVIHPMTVILSATMAYADAIGGVSGKDLIMASVLGVDTACNLGVACKSGLRFFRPATAGAFAAVAGIGKVRGFDRQTLVNAFGLGYGQLCGTMQPHTEGSPLLGMQIGFNARNAVVACDMAGQGIPGIEGVLEGPFGYFGMIETEWDLAPVLDSMGKIWRITEVAHKPFPSGRATHGMIDALLELKSEHGFEASDVAAVRAAIPPLTHHLVGRPIHDEMESNYARLNGQYTIASALITGGVAIEDFKLSNCRDPERVALGRKVQIEIDGNPDPNALTPIKVEIELTDGRKFERGQEIVYGNPAKPMTREAHLGKFRRNWAAAANPVAAENAERMIELVDNLESLDDVRTLIDCMMP